LASVGLSLNIDYDTGLEFRGEGVCEDRIISMDAKGMTTRQLSEPAEAVCGLGISEGMGSDITDKCLY
jgi:transposase-like protein